MLKTVLIILGILICGGNSALAQAESEMEKEMTPEEIQQQLDELFPEEDRKAAEPLNKKIDFIAKNYDKNDLKLIIRNFEKVNRETAKRQEKDYIPYDRRIDVNAPDQVKRFLRRRIDIIF